MDQLVYKMEGKVVVITGSSRGLGAALARVFVSKKAHAVISSRDGGELKKLADEIGATDFVADVRSEAEMNELADKIVSKYGAIDFWINNAGVWLPRALILDVDMKRARDLFDVNVFGTINGSRAALRQMKKQKWGVIVNIVSTSALEPRPYSAIYSASKHAAKGFTDSLREEIKENGISVVGIYPGGIKTNIFDEHQPPEFADFMEPDFVAEKIVEHLEKDVPESELVIKRPGQILK
ncbi:MAG: hypothetical protein A2836_00965 [Candidatus Taylorbacteria bacterium RIFCSPHIGHO2_01_FULL_45_63]|uniref:Oxidoreductase n=1 Tax=Candidatus Taylorbacteria bacterium RIFCSPHIGHO2_02_FULL_45_35 TaxID=1802311 RepID=A0A1G2MUW8_9BACT|nr:MAG: hypothetical protein A2836_00965 [Candidatus Taylorbacteria bacterium RIFCSPHIGHO2_01_FULL_45_63]OHA27656.1 MAG: hypothetical protein A3D56_04200 [Candidatus Taylorbacteria bacterium RIFCSPHIGHO2_02_FULL_45_35]OHA34147.1 MAG: hypothetical protein A3A22_01650 [Candidatus Taylorbacteria bacterium RIFCSPLOWO2_01_FULL_45_34b]